MIHAPAYPFWVMPVPIYLFGNASTRKHWWECGRAMLAVW